MFQGQSERSQSWFYLDFDGLKKLLSHVNLIFIGGYFKGMTKHMKQKYI